MTRKLRIIRQIEVSSGCFIAAIGYMFCANLHWCKCGHLAHGESGEIFPWVVDGLWLMGLVVAGVVGIAGGFFGARLTAVPCMLLAFLSAAYVPSKWLDSLGVFGSCISAFNTPPGSLGFLAVVPLLAAGAFHAISVRAFINRTPKVDSASRPSEG